MRHKEGSKTTFSGFLFVSSTSLDSIQSIGSQVRNTLPLAQILIENSNVSLPAFDPAPRTDTCLQAHPQ